ncbi:hypothetical protein ACU8KI_33980 (plasmid) [Rhizobium leguminosarum]|jgi:hypothetical protein|uniref:hypothetical protein n=1 Tax=Rhizobium hidalgonense TaxID=1538159 RepID=UPI0011073461|nr:hypothetical protein [Rhizobium hidalgonense]QKK27858.1 hypothetical protein FFM81_031475 [Rhizobium hidalgonense]
MRREEVDDELKELAFEFLYFFSRFEYALKANGYLKKEGVGQPAEAGWQKLLTRWESGYVLTDTAAALIAANPQKQVVGADRSLEFRPLAVNGLSTMGQVIGHCQTVRNNLFHGGKSGAKGFDDPKRTKKLLSLTLALLGELATSCDLMNDYTGYY